MDAWTEFPLWRFNGMREEYTYITPGRKSRHLLLVPVPDHPPAHPKAAAAARKIIR